MSQANQSMRGDLSDTQNSIGLRHSVSIAIIVQNSSDYAFCDFSFLVSLSEYD